MPRLLAVVRAGADAPAESTDLFTVHSPALAQLPHREVQSYDRVGWYLSQWTATIPQDADLDALCPAGSSKTYENSLMDDALVCLAMARQALRKDKDVAAFYRNQAGRYDGFRESLLPDRDTFLKYTVPWSRVPTLLKKQPTYALVCVGCGTARDVEFVADHLEVAAGERARRALRPVARAPRASEVEGGQARPRGPRRPHSVRHHRRGPRRSRSSASVQKTAPSWRAPTASR